VSSKPREKSVRGLEQGAMPHKRQSVRGQTRCPRHVGSVTVAGARLRSAYEQAGLAKVTGDGPFLRNVSIFGTAFQGVVACKTEM